MSETPTVIRLQGLLRFYEEGFHSNLIDRAIDKLLETEIQQTESEAMHLWQRLKQYEQQYQMVSAEFYRRFQAGELGDDLELVEWSAFYDMYQAAQQRLDILQGL